jgi:hypothetical protein
MGPGIQTRGGAIIAASSYGGLLLKDLGKGRLEDFGGALNTATVERLTTPQKMESGHVYLQHQQSWNLMDRIRDRD